MTKLVHVAGVASRNEPEVLRRTIAEVRGIVDQREACEVFVLVDDYDLVVTSAGSPLTPLVPLLAQASDVGLHLVVTRRSGGAARALYEPVLQSMRDLAAPGILLSGSPDEGPLIGSIKPTPSVPGRGRLVSRELGNRVVQLAWTPSRHR